MLAGQLAGQLGRVLTTLAKGTMTSCGSLQATQGSGQSRAVAGQGRGRVGAGQGTHQALVSRCGHDPNPHAL